MRKERKTQQLQIRVSPGQKRILQQRAREAGMSVSDWVLSKAIPSPQREFQELVTALARSEQPDLVFAELLDLLADLDAVSYEAVVAQAPSARLDPYWANYLAATVEHAAAQKKVKPPAWTRNIAPLDEPVFGSSLQSLRTHLLLSSPPAFNRRNLFIDASVGDRA